MRLRTPAMLGLCLAVLYGCGGGGSSLTPHYRAVPLNASISNSTVQFYGMNDRGETVGQTEITHDQYNQAVLFNNGKVTELGRVPQAIGGIAIAVNNNNQITGYMDVANDYQQAFFYSNGQLQNINMSGANHSEGRAVNDQGQVVGTSDVPNTGANPLQNAFLWQNGKMTLLGALGGDYSNGNGINNAGQIVGNAQLSGKSTSHAFLWENGRMTDLGALPNGGGSSATAVNNRGQVVGSSYDGNGVMHAVMWQNGTVKDLGVFPGDNSCTAISINDQGDVIGFSNTLQGPGIGKSASNRPTRGAVGNGTAFLYHGGKLLKLDDLVDHSPALTIGAVYKINNQGQILVEAGYQDSSKQIQTGYFLLTPE